MSVGPAKTEAAPLVAAADAVPDAVPEPEAEDVELPVHEAVAEAEAVLVFEGERLVVGDGVGLVLEVAVPEPVAEAEAVLVRDGVGLGDAVVVEVARAGFEADGAVAVLEMHWALYVPLPCGCSNPEGHTAQ
jgi:hypothetical protein